MWGGGTVRGIQQFCRAPGVRGLLLSEARHSRSTTRIRQEPSKHQVVCCSIRLVTRDAAAFNCAWLCCCDRQCHSSHYPSQLQLGRHQVKMKQGLPLVTYTVTCQKGSLSSLHVWKGWGIQSGMRQDLMSQFLWPMPSSWPFNPVLWKSAKSVHKLWIWAALGPVHAHKVAKSASAHKRECT